MRFASIGLFGAHNYSLLELGTGYIFYLVSKSWMACVTRLSAVLHDFFM